MSRKNIYLLSLLFILIIAIFLHKIIINKWLLEKNSVRNFYSTLNINDVTKMIITKNAKTISLELNNNSWKIGGTKSFLADSNKIEQALDSLKKLTGFGLELASKNINNKNDFLTNGQGISLKLFKGENLIKELVIGKANDDFSGTYISEPNMDSTYLVKVNLFSSFNTDWYDKTIFKSDKEKITKIRFQYPKNEFVVERKNNLWEGTVPYKFKVSEDKIEAVIEIMTSLTASEIPEQTFAKTGLEKHPIIVEATGENINNTLIVGNENGNNYYAKNNVNDNIYLVDKNKRNALYKTINDLK